MEQVYTENISVGGFCLVLGFSFSVTVHLKCKGNKLQGAGLEKFYTDETWLSTLAIMLLKIFTFATEDVYKLIHKAWRREKNESVSSKDLIQNSLKLLEILLFTSTVLSKLWIWLKNTSSCTRHLFRWKNLYQIDQEKLLF